MNLPELLEKKNRLFYGRKVVCPFHDDSTPSAILNNNSIYCFSCHKSFSVKAVFIRLGERSEPELNKSTPYEPMFGEKEILFIL